MLLTLAMYIAVATAESAPSTAAIAALGLSPDKVSHLDSALAGHDYVGAEGLLLKEIEAEPHSARGGRLLAYAGSVYFLNHDYLNAAIAWKKSEAIAPLTPEIQFSLAMAYVSLGRSAWARPVLTQLAAQDSRNALYPYWLGRLDYDAHQYEPATTLFLKAVELDPGMARAYDSLGLACFNRNQNEQAVQAFERAIELERNQPHPSPWPYVNLAATQAFLGQAPQAEQNLREALRLDPGFAEGHFQLGNVLEHQGRGDAAVAEFQEAIRLKPQYPEPHLALARIYRRAGRKAEAETETQSYVRLHGVANESAQKQSTP